MAFFENLEKNARLKGLRRFYNISSEKQKLVKKNISKYNFINYNHGLIIIKKKTNLNFFFHRGLKLITLRKKKIGKKKEGKIKLKKTKIRFFFSRRKKLKLDFLQRRKIFNFSFKNNNVHNYVMNLFSEFKKNIFYMNGKKKINKYSKKKIKNFSDFFSSRLYKNKFLVRKKEFNLKKYMKQLKKKKYSLNFKNLTGFLRSTKIESNLTQFIKNYFFFKYVHIINSKPMVRSIFFLEKESIFFFRFFPETLVLHREHMFPYHPKRFDRFTFEFILYKLKEPLIQRKHSLLTKIKSDIVNTIDI